MHAQLDKTVRVKSEGKKKAYQLSCQLNAFSRHWALFMISFSNSKQNVWKADSVSDQSQLN